MTRDEDLEATIVAKFVVMSPVLNERANEPQDDAERSREGRGGQQRAQDVPHSRIGRLALTKHPESQALQEVRRITRDLGMLFEKGAQRPVRLKVEGVRQQRGVEPQHLRQRRWVLFEQPEQSLPRVARVLIANEGLAFGPGVGSIFRGPRSALRAVAARRNAAGSAPSPARLSAR